MSSRITTLMLAGLATTGLAVVGTAPAAQAAPLPALTGDLVGGTKTNVDHVGWRRGYYGGGYGYRRGGGVGGARLLFDAAKPRPVVVRAGSRSGCGRNRAIRLGTRR